MSIDPTNLGATAHLTFDDEFNNLSLWDGQSGTWATTFLFADPHGNGSSLPGNGEQEWYVNSMYAPTAGVHPWQAANGVLTLSAQPTDPSVAGLLGYSNGQGPGLGSYAYTSGLITSAHSFTQTYGYFEMSAKLPAGQGLWPAFWLLPANGNWPPELDAMEVLGKDPSTLYTSAHTDETGTHTSQGLATNVGDTTSGFHTYGIDWEADKVTWYFDHHQVYQIDTPADMHDPMYMLANLAVGGSWGGNADSSTPFPAQMQIDYIRAYADGPGGAATAPPTTDPSTTAPPSTGAGGSPAAPPADGGPTTPEIFTGTDAGDLYFGGSASDQISGGGGADTLNGRMGDDSIFGGDGADQLYGGKGDDVMNGDAGDDWLHGNMGNDTVAGGTGADTVLGGQGNDLLVGGDGADYLSGDRGDDTLSGGAGTDTFHFAPGSGHDVITDFNTWEGDHLQLEPGMTYHASQQGADVLVDFGGGDTVTLQNVQLADLHTGWIG